MSAQGEHVVGMQRIEEIAGSEIEGGEDSDEENSDE